MKFHTMIGFAYDFMVVLNKDFCFHIVYVKIMLELGSGLVLGPMVHRIPNIFRLLYFI